MNRFRFTIKVFAITTFVLAFASIAQAQASRTWVSGVGDDANPWASPGSFFRGVVMCLVMRSRRRFILR